MDKKQFAERVANPVKFTSQERGWLHAMSAKYPHSSIVSAMALLADRAFHFDTPEERRAVALAVCDMGRIDSLINSVKPTVDEQPFDILNEINTFQEVSFKTAPKSVILSNFLQMTPADEQKMSETGNADADLTDKNSLSEDESIGTETLAVILEKQGKYAKALAIYKNLLAHNPEKNSIFAPRIEKLESLLNSK
ncbi:MAG: tetratricopeptide repeat protein [Bacteroidales bacterium]|nr:tetratricopeptide repeat protein [Bacteroidales bacterium]